MSHRARIMQALQSSNESLQEDPNAAAAAAGAGDQAVVEAPVEEPAEVEQPLMEVAAAENEADQAMAAADEAVEVAEALESLQEILEAQSEDGLNPQAAQITQFAVESLYKRVGISGHGLPSLESFSTHSNRVKSTQYSAEAIGAKLKEFWAAIVQMLTKAKDMVVDFIKKTFDAQYRVAERAKKLSERAKKLTGVPREKELDLGPLANKLAIGDKVPAPLHTAITAIQDVLKDVQNFGEAELNTIKATHDFISKVVASGQAFDGEGPALTKGIEIPSAAAFKNAVEGRGGVKATDVLPGNVQFFVGSEESKMGNLTANYAVSGKMKKDVKLSNTSMPVMGKEEIVQACSAVELLLQQAKSVSENATKSVDASKKLFQGIKIGDEAKIKDQVQLRSLMRAFQKQEAEHGKAAGRVAAYAVELSNDVLNAVQKHMVKYDQGTAEAGTAKIGQDKKDDKK